jgi:hypothetical protein
MKRKEGRNTGSPCRVARTAVLHATIEPTSTIGSGLNEDIPSLHVTMSQNLKLVDHEKDVKEMILNSSNDHTLSF